MSVLHFSFVLEFTSLILPAYPEDFLGTTVDVTFAPGSSEECVTVALMDSADLEFPESFLVHLQLLNPAFDDGIVLNEDYNEGIVEIIDDDGRC